MANLKDLIVNGVSRFIGKVFINDSRIEVINNSTVGDNPKFTDTTYSAVGTSGNPGLMSTADKVKLNTIATSATRNTFSAITGNPTSNQTPSFGGTFNIYQVGQTTAGAISTTARTVKIPDTDATTAVHGLLTAADKIKINALTTADATTSAHGYLTAADKIKLNALSTVDNNTTYAVVTTAAAGLSPKLSGSATQYLNGTGNWTTPTNTTYADATTSAHGLLTAADKIKLNALTTADATTSAHGYLTAADKIKLNALSTVDNNTTYGLVTTAANGLAPKLSNSVTQYLNGQGAWTTPTNTTYADVTTSAHGLMTAADKIKLNAISTVDNDTKQEAFFQWGGKNLAGAYSPIDAALVGWLGANRFAGIPAAAVTVEYTRDNGSTWTSYGASDSSKRNLFTSRDTFVIGKADSTNKATANGTKYQLRVTINTGTGNVYTSLHKFIFYVSTNGSAECTVKIQAALQNTPDNYVDITGDVTINGWSGWNVVNTSSFTTYGNSPASQYGRVRFLFKANGGNTTYNGLVINSIYGYGGVGWITPSNLARTGDVYTYDGNLNTTFPAGLTAVNGTFTTINGVTVGSSPKFSDTTYALATTAANGLMASTDKQHLNSAYTHAVTNKGTSAAAGLYKIKTNSEGHVTGTTAVTKADITALGIPGTDTNTTYAAATTGAAGLMSSADKAKLDSIASSATRNTFSTFTGAPTSNQTPGFGGTFNIYQVGQTTAGAITTTARTVKIPDSAATTAAAGLMSAADKIKLNNCSTGSSLQYVKDGTNHSVILSDTSNNTASGIYSVAEGNGTLASDAEAHAEGMLTVASGSRSHAEGEGTTASGNAAHAEGFYTQATGNESHAEGAVTLTSGHYSHAEGQATTASGQQSHAEGSHTIAKFKSQHVFGEYNVVDPSTAETSQRGTYVEIVGNGTTVTRNNARTLDWSGNERLTGSLYVNNYIYGRGFNSYRWSATNLFDSAYQTAFLGTAMSSIGEVNGHLFLYGNMTTATNSSTRSLLADFGKITYTNSYGTLVDNQPALRLYHTNGSDTSWLAANRGYISNGAFAGFMVYGKTPQHSYNMDWTTNGLIMYVDTTNVGKVTLTSSDARVKTDIKPLGEQYKDAISSLDFKEFKYDFKDPVRSEANGLKRFGVIAQDVIAAFEEQGLDWKQSEIVETTENEDDTYYTINYVPFLITRLAADEDRIKQLEETIEKLTTRLDALEGK